MSSNENRIPELNAEVQALAEAYKASVINRSQAQLQSDTARDNVKQAQEYADRCRKELREATKNLQAEMERVQKMQQLATPLAIGGRA